MVYAPQQGGVSAINTPSSNVRPFGAPQGGPGSQGGAQQASSNTPHFTAKDMPAANGSASSLCEAGTPGCVNAVGQGDPVTGSPLMEPPSMAPHLVAPGPTAFERDETVRLAIPQPIHHQVFSAHSLFAFNQAKLSTSGRARLREVAQGMDLRHLHAVTVVAYTDSFGTDAYNQRLSQRRAQVAADELVHDGVPASMVYVNNFARQDYIVDPASCHGTFTARKRCEAPNRRVVIETSGMSTLPVVYPLHHAVRPWSSVVENGG